MGTADETKRRWSCCRDGTSVAEVVVAEAEASVSALTGIEDLYRRLIPVGTARDLLIVPRFVVLNARAHFKASRGGRGVLFPSMMYRYCENTVGAIGLRDEFLPVTCSTFAGAAYSSS